VTTSPPGDGSSVRLLHRAEGGRTWPVLLWSPGPAWQTVSTAVEGGGLGRRSWWLNTQVERLYDRPDPAAHVREIAAALGLTGAGVGMLTAADVSARTRARDAGVAVTATVGLGLPVFAAVADRMIAAETAPAPGTINLLVVVPVPLSDAALVNAVITATEAKTQALVESRVPGTGTSSDAVCIACPAPSGEPPEPFGGPRSIWGARIARAVHAAVTEGTRLWLQRHPDGDPHRPWRLVLPSAAGSGEQLTR
jgi:adenosylcobinamide hydrolase